jgi:hypothetical protein
MSLPNIVKIDLNAFPISAPALCIPRVHINVNESQIRKIFDELELGTIDRVDLVPKYTYNGEKYNRIFIHFKKWFYNENAKKARERLLSGFEIKVIYEQPFFWKVSAYREQNITQRQQIQEKQIQEKQIQEEEIQEKQIQKSIKHMIAQLPIQLPSKISNKISEEKDIDFKSQTPTLLPPAPKQLRIEDINIENTNEINKNTITNTNTDINEKSKKLEPIDKKIKPIQVKKILFNK